MERPAVEKDASEEALKSPLASGQQDAVWLLHARYAPTVLAMAAQTNSGRALLQPSLRESQGRPERV
jgi:hypothetical protein